MAGVLEGVRVVAMEHFVAVPLASALMADWGADVIKVEPLTGELSRGLLRVGGVSTSIIVGGIKVNPHLQFQNRNKKSLAVDLKKESGRDILCQLVQKADVFMSNNELNSLKRLRLDYDTLSQLNPRLIYAVLTGYGSKGPDRDEQAFEEVAAWARSGMQYTVTELGCPPPRGPRGMGDRNASAHIVAGILGALLHREKTGKGQELEFSLFHCALWSVSGVLIDEGALGGRPTSPKVDRTKSETPLHIAYRSKDDRWIQFAMTQSDRYWPDFCQAIGRPELEKDPRFNNMETRAENCEELIRILDEVFASKTIDEWERLCRKHHLISSRVKTPEEVVNDPQAVANDCFVDSPHPAGPIKVLASPVKFRQNPASVRAPAPEVGQHTEEILLDLGYSWEDITRLKEQGVIL